MMNRFTKMNKCPFNSKYLKLKVNVRTFHTSSAYFKKVNIYDLYRQALL